jgi:DNA-binding XRE family transcriptional regulator
MKYTIKEAVKKGLLISHSKVLASYSKEDQEDIKRLSKYFSARAEIRRLRIKMKLTQEQLAEKMDVKREYISRIESGNQNITLETLIRIASAVGKEFKFKFE